MASRVSDFYQYTALTKRIINLRERKTELSDKILLLESLQAFVKGLRLHAAHSILVRINQICHIQALLRPNEYIVKHGSHRSLLSSVQLIMYMENASKDFQAEHRHCLQEIDQIEQRLDIMDEYGVKEIVQVDENSFTVNHDSFVEIVEVSPTMYHRSQRTCRFKTKEERDAYLKSAQKKKKP